jgi:hypothetical protein
MMSSFTKPLTVNACPELAKIQAKLGIPLADGSTICEDCLIVSVDSETFGWSRDPEHQVLTEGGYAVLDTRKLKSLPPYASNFDITSYIECYHIRPKETSMLRNGKAKHWGSNFDHAEDFHYGRTECVVRSQIEHFTKSVLMIPIVTSPTGFLPVYLIYQGTDDDPKKIGKFATPPFQFMTLPCIVESIELQTISGKAIEGNIGLASVAATLNLVEDAFHNAGNDAMVQLVAPIQMAITEYRQRIPEQKHIINDVPRNELLRRLGERARQTPPPLIIGTKEHCNRCGSDQHTQTKQRGSCPVRNVGTCKRCLGYNQHITAKCYMGADDNNLERRRLDNHATTAAECARLNRPIPTYVPLGQTNISRRDHILEPVVPRNQAARVAHALAPLPAHQSLPAQQITNLFANMQINGVQVNGMAGSGGQTNSVSTSPSRVAANGPSTLPAGGAADPTSLSVTTTSQSMVNAPTGSTSGGIAAMSVNSINSVTVTPAAVPTTWGQTVAPFARTQQTPVQNRGGGGRRRTERGGLGQGHRTGREA